MGRQWSDAEIDELERLLAEWRRRTRRAVIVPICCMAVMLALVAAVVWWRLACGPH